MEAIQEVLARAKGLATMSNPMTVREYEQFKVDGLNATEGRRHEEDGYNCKTCKNKGFIVKLKEMPNGSFSRVVSDCKCADVRKTILRMKKSGLKDIIKDYTFDAYTATEGWQKSIKAAAMEYAASPEGWFFIGGQSGAGKTHLCTAVCRDFLYAGRQVVYMLWRDDIARLKSLAMEPDERQAMIDRFKTAEVLYIDDLFKTGKGQDGRAQRPTGPDITTAFEIINYRYNNPQMITIISSEWTEDELMDIDEATGGRIFEKSKTISIGRDRKRNYRTRKAVVV